MFTEKKKLMLCFEVYFKSSVLLHPLCCRNMNYVPYGNEGNRYHVPEHCDLPWSEVIDQRI